MSEIYTLEMIKKDLVTLAEDDKMDTEKRKAKIAALHALADILLREEGK